MVKVLEAKRIWPHGHMETVHRRREVESVVMGKCFISVTRMVVPEPNR